ncbi:MAG: hypothetical protein ACNYPE_07070 [Candidatus Azotimanducaceae bacterium WSBS_2022_MAG_OTU7]
MRLCVLLMGIAELVLGEQGTLIAIICLMGLFGVFEGMQGVVFNFLMSKSDSCFQTWSINGVTQFSCGHNLCGGCLHWWHLSDWEGPRLRATRLRLSSVYVLTTIRLASLLAVQEPEPPTVVSRFLFGNKLKEVPALLNSDRAFTRCALSPAQSRLWEKWRCHFISCMRAAALVCLG